MSSLAFPTFASSFMVKAILNLKEVPKPDDTADAVAAAICHGHSRGRRLIR